MFYFTICPSIIITYLASSPVRNISVSGSVNRNDTLIVVWSAPEHPNGNIHNYSVIVESLASEMTVANCSVDAHNKSFNELSKY